MIFSTVLLQSFGLWGALHAPEFPAPLLNNGQEDAATATAAPETPADRLDAIIARYDAAYDAFLEAYRSAEGEEAKGKVVEELYPDPDQYLEPILEIARSEADSETGFHALEWGLENGRGSDKSAEIARMLTEHHVLRTDLQKVMGVMAYEYDPSIGTFLEAVLAKNESIEMQAHACFSLGQHCGNRANLAEQSGMDKAEVAALRDKQFECFERLEADETLGAVAFRRGTMADRAASHLFELRNLAVGQVAPNIEGTDADDVAFQLNDYRGQVVLLDFWGDW